ncbi:hypothetical protein XENOCAPTIV_029439 [Xenoophorus captivus]|uniref:Uncharacterized protein n=1 Tax=Xenoophorus captivus TaxID=1517983 RepID=A0ABV0Q6Q2_9TELE
MDCNQGGCILGQYWDPAYGSASQDTNLLQLTFRTSAQHEIHLFGNMLGTRTSFKKLRFSSSVYNLKTSSLNIIYIVFVDVHRGGGQTKYTHSASIEFERESSS